MHPFCPVSGGIKIKGDKCNMVAFISLYLEIGATLLAAMLDIAH
jgi:hypothetical protein